MSTRPVLQSSSQPTILVPPAEVGDVVVRAGGRVLGQEELRQRMAGALAILIPAYGEAENLRELLPRVPDAIGDLPTCIVVVDDGSRDGTTEVALEAGAIAATLASNQGGGAALRVGYALAANAGASIVVTMDADGQHRPEELEALVEPVVSGRVELAQGSRTLGSAEPGAFARELGIAFFNRLVRALTGTPVSDCSNGFKAIRTEALVQLDLRQPQFHAAELLIEAVTRGFALEEVPITVLRRRYGSSKKPPTLRYGAGFSRAILLAWRRSLGRRARGRAREIGRTRSATGRAEG